MNYLNRINKIERSINKPEMYFAKLLSPEFVYSGKPFTDFEKMLKYFNITEQVPFWRTSELIAFIEKGIMSIESDVGQELLRLAREEIKAKL